MTPLTLLSANAALAWSAYFVGTASPGPSNLSIMSIAMHEGRRPAFVFALGVMSGSFCWAVTAALGLSALLVTYSTLLIAVKLCGGVYLLWLGWKSARSACSRAAPTGRVNASGGRTGARLYLRGLLMHLTNPKAILVWISIVSIALPTHAAAGPHLRQMAVVVGGCLGIGLGVFSGYALLFSTAAARRVYLVSRDAPLDRGHAGPRVRHRGHPAADGAALTRSGRNAGDAHRPARAYVSLQLRSRL